MTLADAEASKDGENLAASAPKAQNDKKKQLSVLQFTRYMNAILVRMHQCRPFFKDMMILIPHASLFSSSPGHIAIGGIWPLFQIF